MKSALRLALRDLRGGLSGLGLLWLCLAVAIAGLASVTSLASSVDSAIAANGRAAARRRPDAVGRPARGERRRERRDRRARPLVEERHDPRHAGRARTAAACWPSCRGSTPTGRWRARSTGAGRAAPGGRRSRDRPRDRRAARSRARRQHPHRPRQLPSFGHHRQNAERQRLRARPAGADGRSRAWR